MPESIRNLFKSKIYNISPVVLLAFNSKFPKAKKIIWQRIGVFKCQVSFSLRKKKHTALFDSEGRWLETVCHVPLHKIPKPIQYNFEEKYSRDAVQQFYHVQTPDRNFYEMKVHNGINALNILYDISGKTMGQLIL